MYSDTGNNRSLRWVLLPALLLAAAVLFAALRTPSADDGSAGAIRDAIERAALQCYAVEGAYPPNLAWLQENYGLTVNTEDYYITYDAFASNLAPTVIVTPKYPAKGGSP